MAKKLTISASDFLPAKQTLPALRTASKTCEGCHLYKNATQTVFGAGPANASVLVVGEIPGEKEDETGIPFTGPAGTLLRSSIAEAGLDPEDIYFTNVVKHFKFALIGHRKMHRSPIGAEIRACMPWLESEIDVVQPKSILCLGATAAKALLNNNQIKIKEQRGKWFPFTDTISLLITFHPAAILRAITKEDRHKMRKLFVKDIHKVAVFLAKQHHLA